MPPHDPPRPAYEEFNTDMVTILADIAARNPVVMGTHNEPVCFFCGWTHFPRARIDERHRLECLWRRANAVVEAMRG